MGFGVSGATAVVVVGLFVSAGIFYDAAATSYEAVDEAEDDRAEALLEQRNTAVAVANAAIQSPGNALVVTMENTGSTTLGVPETTLLAENVVVPHDANATWAVESDTGTEVWLPGETLEVTVSRTWLDTTFDGGDPTRVKVATDTGVSDAAEVR
ncbi:fla cluster protein FlaF [Salinirubellus salinus]|uniref:Fla cluster protein FlaF n=1 Tax=Salinirubellus salinus TaxID=1364945 RepID=A0A9E7U9F1_9EURY|nr:fla cluster protein FlaF [Salinirubellus salinus]UWM52982.1 fla cluster protein FlaF [Salinirubellus salinus]